MRMAALLPSAEQLNDGDGDQLDVLRPKAVRAYSQASYRSTIMTQIPHSGLTKAHIREHIIGLCKDAHEFSLLQNVSTKDVQGVAFAIQCRRVAKDLEQEHQRLFEELTSLAANVNNLTHGTEPEDLCRAKVADCILLVMEELKTY